MKMQVFRKILALISFTAALNAAVWAQGFDHKIRAEVPFNFYAGGKLLPAGSYTFGFNVENHYLMIVNGQGAQGALVMGSPNSIDKDGRSVLVFRTDGEGVYALESLQTTDFAVGFHADRTLSRFARNSGAESTTTVIAAP